MGFAEILLIVVLASVLLGPEKLPGAIRQASATLSSWRAELRGVSEKVAEDLDFDGLRSELEAVREELDELRRTPQMVVESVDEVKRPAAGQGELPESGSADRAAGAGRSARYPEGEGVSEDSAPDGG